MRTALVHERTDQHMISRSSARSTYWSYSRVTSSALIVGLLHETRMKMKLFSGYTSVTTRKKDVINLKHPPTHWWNDYFPSLQLQRNMVHSTLRLRPFFTSSRLYDEMDPHDWDRVTMAGEVNQKVSSRNLNIAEDRWIIEYRSRRTLEPHASCRRSTDVIMRRSNWSIRHRSGR